MPRAIRPTCAGRLRQRADGAANAGALTLPVATATLRPGFGHRAEVSHAVDDPDRWVRIDGTGPVDEVAETVWHTVVELTARAES